MRYRYWIAFGASILLALVFIASGVGKLLGQSAFLLDMSMWLTNPTLANFVAGWLPWAELALGVCLLIGIVPRPVAGISTLLIVCFIIYNGWMISQGRGYEPCGCLGILDRVLGGELSTTSSLYIDIGLIILALSIFFCYPGKFLNIRPWFLNRDRTVNISSARVAGNNRTADGTLPDS